MTQRIMTATKTIPLDGDVGWRPASEATAKYLNAYVLRCIQLHAGAVSSVPLVRMDTKQPVDIPPSVVFAADASLLLAGAAYLLPPTRQTPWRVLNPYTVTVETDAMRGITGFTQRVGAATVRFTRTEIIYARTWSPYDDLGPGLSAYDAARGAADVIDSAETFTRAFFAQGALPPVIVKPSAGSVMSDVDVTALKAAFRAVVSGVKNAWRALVLRGDITVQALDLPALSNLAMRDVVDVARQRIAVAFGIPQTLIEDAANYATAKEHRISFWRETVIPSATIIADALSEQYYRRVHQVRVIADATAVEALQQDEATKAAAIVKLYDAGIITRDEARRQLNLDTGDPAVHGQETTQVAVGAPDGNKSIKAELGSSTTQPDLDSSITAVTRALVRLFNEWRDTIESLVRNGRSFTDEDVARLRREIADVLRSHVMLAIMDTAEAFSAQAGVGDYETLIDLVDAFLQRYTVATTIAETTTNEVQTILRRIAAAEIGNEEALARLATIFGQARAQMIAITEITRAYAVAATVTQQMLRDSGIETTLIWRTSNDELVCPICGPRNGKRQGEGWTDPPPAHPRCRCWVTIEVNV